MEADPQLSIGPSSWTTVEEREEGLYEQDASGRGRVRSMKGKTTEPSYWELTDCGLITGGHEWD